MGSFSFSESTLCADLLGVRSIPMSQQWHVKDPCDSVKTASVRLHLNMHTPLTQQSLSSRTMLLSRHSVGTYLELSSQATRQGTFSHSHLSSLSHHGLILTQKVQLMCAS